MTGAYYKGTPIPAEQGGRDCFMFIPKWLSELFPEQYPLFDAHGHRNSSSSADGT